MPQFFERIWDAAVLVWMWSLGYNHHIVPNSLESSSFWENPEFGTFHGVRRWLTRGLTCKSVYASKSQPTRPTHHPPLITESRDCPAPSIVLNLCCNHILPPSFLSHHRQLELQLTLSIAALRYLSLGQEASREEVRTTSATSVYEVARPILQGCHAIPTKLKILLDRALSALAQEEVLMIVSGCGWQLDDYQRGYKLKVTYPSPPNLSWPTFAIPARSL